MTKQWHKILLRSITVAACAVLSLSAVRADDAATGPAGKDIYHDGWTDMNKNGRMDPYEDPKLAVDQRVEDLIGRMNVSEKTCQMVTLYGYKRVLKDPLPTPQWKQSLWKDGIGNIDEHLNGVRGTAIPYSTPPSRHAESLNQVQRFFVEETRLGIPADFTNEGIRGLCNRGATCLPAQIGVGSTWDVELVSQIGQITGKEGKLLGYSCVYAPILDLARDPRWGRTVECYTEDPYLASRLGVAMVKALQAEGVASSPKHFAVYSIPKGGRDDRARTDPHVGPREMETILLAPFRAAVIEGKCRGVMSSYNDYDGIPVTGNPAFLVDRLRRQWGFRGYVVSDSDAVKFIHSKHRIAAEYKGAVYHAVTGGMNVRTTFTMPSVFVTPLRELIAEGKLSMAVIDSRVRDVLRVKYNNGLFDHPYRTDAERAEADRVVRCKEHQDISLRASRESLVLLKNEGQLLPLKKDIKTILVTGPNAMAVKPMQSRYGPDAAEIITVLDGIKAKVAPDTVVRYTPGCEIITKNWPRTEILPEPPTEQERQMLDEAREAARKADVAIVVVGEDERVVGESLSRTSLDLPGLQRDLVQAIHGTGTPTVVVLINGRPLSINWTNKYVPAIIEAWFPGEYCGQAVAEVLFGNYNPGGKLPITFPKTVGQLPMNFPCRPGSQSPQSGSRPHGEGRTRVEGVLYPFGHGLSYTEFQYDHLRISPEQCKPDGQVTVEVDVTNVGKRRGDEVVQLYLRDDVSSVVTYEKLLRGFERIALEPGEKETVRFTLQPADLALLDRQMKWTVEPGTFTVMLGSSSEDIRATGEFEVIQ